MLLHKNSRQPTFLRIGSGDMDARRTGTHSDLFQSCAEGPLLTDNSTATCSWSCKSKTGQNPAGKDTPRRESSIAKVYQSHFHIRSTIHFFFCMSDPRPSLLSQSGCTRRYFVFSQACSFIYNPTPPFNSQPTELFALLQSGDSQKLILVTQLAGPPQVIFSTQQIKIKWTYFRLLFILRLQQLLLVSVLANFVLYSSSRGCSWSHFVFTRSVADLFLLHNFLFLLLVVVM